MISPRPSPDKLRTNARKAEGAKGLGAFGSLSGGFVGNGRCNKKQD